MNKIKCLLIMGGILSKAGVPNVLKTIIKETNNRVDYTLVIAKGEHPELQSFQKLGVEFQYLNHAMPNNGLMRKLWFYGYRLPYLNYQMSRIITSDYDVVYCVSGPVEGMYLKTAKRRGISIRIAHCHGKVSHSGNFLKRLQIWILRYLIDKYATVKLTCSKEAGESLFLDTSDMITVVNGIDLSLYREVHKLESQKLRLLQIGYYNPIKNQLFSLEVLKALIARGVDVSLVFVGYSIDVEYYHQLLNAISESELNEYIVFLGADANKCEVFAECDVLLLPSESEACPLVALEAQAAYTPVCASDHVPRDVDFGMCEYVEHNNVKAWCDVLVNMKQTQYKRSDKFAEIEQKRFAEKIYCLMQEEQERKGNEI